MPDNHQDRLEREALESLVADDLSAKMKQWRANNQPPPRNRRWIILLLCMLLVSGGVALHFWPKNPQPLRVPAPPEMVPETPAPPAPAPQPSPSPNYASLVRQHYRTPDFSTQIRGTTSDAPANIIRQAQTAISQRQYTQALALLEQASPEYQSEARYLRGHACFGLKQYAQAASHFQALESSVRYGELASWYLQLARLAQNPASVQQIRKQLQTMAETEGHTCQQEAAELLKALK